MPQTLITPIKFMDLPGSTIDYQSTLSALSTPIFSDNVQDVLGVSTFGKNPNAIITVNSTADVVDDNDGVTTLREAINQANADNGEDLIVFERSLFSSQQTITLSLGELDITHNLSILAPRDELTGENLVTVSGSNTSRVFEIETEATVNLLGLMIESGNVTGDNGGGIKNSGTLNLDSSIVRNNFAITAVDSIGTGTGGYGGGIYNSGTMYVSNSTLTNNRAGIPPVGTAAGEGGGIYNIGTLTVSNSTLTSNAAIGEYFGSNSGGIFNSGILTVNNSTLSGNSGGISNSGTLTVNNSNLNRNSGNGGGIYNSGTSTVNNSILSDNIALSGGGIANSGTLIVINSTLKGNRAVTSRVPGFGGGISNTGNRATVVVSNSTITGNSAEVLGGGIYNNLGNVEVSNSTISDNSANNPNQYAALRDGGGIFNDGTLTVSNSTISGNSAGSNGGGIFNGNVNLSLNVGNAIVNVNNTTFTGNSALSNGGGIFDSIGTMTLVFDTFALNSAANGGGIFISDNGAAFVRNTIIASNLNSADGFNPDISGNFTSNGYNLIGDSTGSTGFDATGDIVGTSDNPIDPRLAPLDFYGGTTKTFALLPDSPAIDAGDPTVLDTDPTTDQRGFPRVSGTRADIGASEFFVPANS